MKRALGALLITAAVAAVAAFARAPAPLELALDAQSVPKPLLGISYGDYGAYLTRLDPLTLRPTGRRVYLYDHKRAWSFSPRRDRLALADNHGHLLFVDPVRLRRVGRLSFGTSNVEATAWLGSQLLVVERGCCQGKAYTRMTVVDPARRRVVRRTRINAVPHELARTPRQLVILLGPAGRVGPATLAVADPLGRVRTVKLERIPAGITFPADPTKPTIEPIALPGLAVDEEGVHAFVVSGGAPVAKVNLRSLAVSYHEPAQPVSLFGRLHDWLEPPARAKGPWHGPQRQALWLDGRLAVTGADAEGFSDAEGRLQGRSVPAGLKLVDTRTWSVRTLDPNASATARAKGFLLAFGMAWDSSTQVMRGEGLRGYSSDGQMRFHLFGQDPVADVVAVGERAFAFRGRSQRYAIVDLVAGRVVGTVRGSLPSLLLGAGSPY